MSISEKLNFVRHTEKKKLCMLFFVMLLSVSSSFAIGIGLHIGGGYDFEPGLVSATLKLDNRDIIFNVDLGFGTGEVYIGVSNDYWLLNKPIAGPVRWFIGLGWEAGYHTGKELDETRRTVCIEENFGVKICGRVPVGITSSFLNGRLEPYLQIIPLVGIGIAKNTSYDPSGYSQYGVVYPHFGFDAVAGMRVWF